MELRQLQYLVAVAEEASFTRAAARVQIAQLERELGERLFDRSDRKVRLTAAGEAFLPHARAALDATGAGRDAVRSLTGLLTGRLVVGVIQAPPPAFTQQLTRFSPRYPRVRLTIRVGHPGQLTDDVAGGAVDLAVLALAGQRLPATLAVRALHVEPLVLAVAPDHALARRSWITLSVLQTYPVVTMSRPGGLRAALDSACARAGITPQIAAETDDVSLV